jgi:hypothetical protein
VADPGSNAVFTVTVTGTPPLFYQWAFNDNDIPGATTNPFVLTNVQYTNAGNYSVSIGNAVGNTFSGEAELIVRPAITQGVFTNGAFRLTLNGTPGKQYAVEKATNMIWAPIGSVINSTIQMQYQDPSAPSSNTAYRLRLMP